MLSLLTTLLPGVFTAISSITNAIANEKIAAINATTDEARIAAQQNIAALEAQKAALIATHSPWTNFVQFIIGTEVAFVLGKLLVWDKALGDYTHGHTDKIDPNMWWCITAVVGFYFVAGIFKK